MKGIYIVALGPTVDLYGGPRAQAPAGDRAEGESRAFQPWVALGMSPAAALRSAGPVAAELLGLSGEIGTLEGGKEADIVAVPGSPLEEINVSERVLFVMKGGRVVPGAH